MWQNAPAPPCARSGRSQPASHRFSMRVQPVAALVLAALACEAGATDVTVVGLFSGKAVVTVNRGAPRTLSVGQTTPEGVKLLAVDAKGATLEVDGRREVLEMGQHS